jgi:hypothetical protein
MWFIFICNLRGKFYRTFESVMVNNKTKLTEQFVEHRDNTGGKNQVRLEENLEIC